ncbi:g4704 [Coccomyxa elongata]
MDFISWLETLPADTVGKLYTSHWACQAVLRGLTSLAKQYVIRILFLDVPVATSVVDSWTLQSSKSKHTTAVNRLKGLQLLLPSTVPSKDGKAQAYILHPVFREQLRWAVSKGRNVGTDEVPSTVFDRAPSRDQLTQYAQQQWETLMLYLVGSVDRPPSPSPLIKGPKLDVDKILAGAHLMTGSKKSRSIQEQGFRFLLSDTYSQLWRLLRVYIATGEERSRAPLGTILNFLLQLGFRDVGSPFALAELDDIQRNIAGDMAQLGLIMPFSAKDGSLWLAPTRLALALAGGNSGQLQHEVTDGFIVVETNYRVYAYTSSLLQTAILRLFTRCECVLPNLFVGVLTRESISGALACGLNADQIVLYLRQHAHPHVASRTPVVPEVVADQVRLWQADTQRVQHNSAILYDDFPSPEVFRLSAQKARALGVWLWEDPKAGMGRLAVLESGHQAMREYIKSIK